MFVVFLALKPFCAVEVKLRAAKMDLTVPDALAALNRLTVVRYLPDTASRHPHVTSPDPLQRTLLQALGITLPA